MAEPHSAWHQTLDPGKKQALRELHQINPYWNLVGPLFICLWILVAILIVRFPHPLLRVVGYCAIGVLIHGMANLMHEGIHGTLFRHRRWDRWYGFVMAAPSLFSITAYGVNHLLHHRHNRTAKDPDEFSNVTTNARLLAIFYYVWIVVGMFLYVLHVPYTGLTKGTHQDRLRILFEYLVIGSGLIAALLFCWNRGQAGLLVDVWLIPLLFAAFLGNVRGWAEHSRTQPGHPLTETRTVTSNRVFSFFNINLNYHLEHHLFPGVPWYNLPKVHRLLLDDYRAAGTCIDRSYVLFLLDAFRGGIHQMERRVPSGEQKRRGSPLHEVRR